MIYIILSNLQVVLFFVCLIAKGFKKVFIYCLVMGSIVIYCTIIIPNKIINYIELKVVEVWLI